ncbi:hypothetical protein HPB51_025037 [Rhipicephalus microplus]|uniref:Uncharacterized protein n=1 Tax=Rhipicephalus microplus TaxID=6941 RepID=A0A9J6DDB4_RHIMP|nr:hypothetical protein HPB51_025037 [Rhipicephalus microplus]
MDISPPAGGGNTPNSTPEAVRSSASAMLLPQSPVTLAQLPKMMSQLAGTRGLPKLDDMSPQEVVISSNKQLNSNFRLVAVSKFETLFVFEVGNVVVRWWQQVSADLRHLKCFYVDSGVVVTVFSATSLYPMTASFLQRRPVSEDIDGQPLLSCVMEL